MRALNKDILKEIKVNYKRFISLVLMAFLGVGFFVGIRVTSPSMLKSVDKLYKSQNFYDVQVISTLGLTKDDLEKIKSLDGVKDAKGVYFKEALIESDEGTNAVKIISITDIATPYLVDGKMPDKNEIVIEQDALKKFGYKIGDEIELKDIYQENDEGEKEPFLNNEKYTISGTIISPEYLDINQGSSSIGSGTLDFIIYVNEQNINNKDIMTSIYIKSDYEDKIVTNTKEYKDKIKVLDNNLEQIKEESQRQRADNIKKEAYNKIQEQEEKLNSKEQEFNNSIEENQNKINQNKITLEQNQAKLTNARNTFNNEIANKKKQLNQGYEQLNQALDEFNKNSDEANKTKEELLKQKEELKIKKEELENTCKTIDDAILNLENSLDEIPEDKKVEVEEQVEQLKANKQIAQESIIQIDETIKQIDDAILQIDTNLEQGKIQLEKSKSELDEGFSQLKTISSQTLEQFNKNQQVLDDSKKQLEDAQNKLEDEKQKYNEEFKKAREEILDARQKVNNIENPKWYILDRTSNQSYSSFMQDVDSIKNISYVFPILFFLVAILISLNSMTRMVEEQRTLIGTYKALGYSKMQIALKYLIFSILATLLGGIIGAIVGINIIPSIIWSMYTLMYRIPNFVLDINLGTIIFGIVILIFCIVGATILTLISQLKEVPAQLMRPKPPKSGKRVFLEKIPFIWKHLSFNSKVTVRNLFRYKKRFLMTIIGIMGTTALVVVGFGIKDSISSLIETQYGKIFKYDLQVILKDDLKQDELEKTIKKIGENENIEIYLPTNLKASKISKQDSEDIQLIVVENEEEFNKMFNLTQYKSDEKLNLSDDGIIITEKVAQLIGAKPGDEISVEIDNKEQKIQVSDIAHNYISHYGYMKKDVYEKYFEQFYPNVIYLKENNENISQDEISKQLLEIPEVNSVNVNKNLLENLDKSLKSLNSVSYVLIIAAGLLAFVVLYNLASVNISERKRELATIKVLGFYDKEVYNYISQETIILTIIGIALGLIGGYFLTSYILITCEINSLRFMRIVKPLSFVISASITVIFTIIVNIITYFTLKKIDMIESLKSVE